MNARRKRSMPRGERSDFGCGPLQNDGGDFGFGTPGIVADTDSVATGAALRQNISVAVSRDELQAQIDALNNQDAMPYHVDLTPSSIPSADAKNLSTSPSGSYKGPTSAEIWGIPTDEVIAAAVGVVASPVAAPAASAANPFQHPLLAALATPGSVAASPVTAPATTTSVSVAPALIPVNTISNPFAHPLLMSYAATPMAGIFDDIGNAIKQTANQTFQTAKSDVISSGAQLVSNTTDNILSSQQVQDALTATGKTTATQMVANQINAGLTAIQNAGSTAATFVSQNKALVLGGGAALIGLFIFMRRKRG